jgi:hypothetical protein
VALVSVVVVVVVKRALRRRDNGDGVGDDDDDNEGITCSKKIERIERRKEGRKDLRNLEVEGFHELFGIPTPVL